MTKIKTAVILCGGKGTRLGLIGKKTAKSLVCVQKKPILWYILNQLILKYNFNHIILPLGYKGLMIKDYVAKNFISSNKIFRKVKFDLVETGLNTEISKRILNVYNKIMSDHFLLLNGDAIFDFGLANFYEEHVKKNLDLSMMTCEVTSPFGVVILKKNKPINFIRNMKYNSIYSSKKNIFGEIFTGMSIIKTSLLKKIKIKKHDNFELSFYPKILKLCKTYKFQNKKVNGFWYAMDDLKQVELANSFKNKNFISKKIQAISKKINDTK
jgi:glucose-1-phosphate cytidylyltransferase